MSQHTLILASSSPSRRQVLRSGGVEPLIISPGIDEDALLHSLADQPAAHKVAALARSKAHAVIEQLAPDQHPELAVGGGRIIVVACDSMLLYDGELSGKPYTETETIRRWQLQRGKAAELLTGHCVIEAEVTDGEVTQLRQHCETIATTVHFGSPTNADIAVYAATGEPLGCAGAFTLEALGGWFIDRIEGDTTSVLGLSLPLLRRTLNGWGYQVSEFWRD